MKPPREDRFKYKRTYAKDPDAPPPEELEGVLALLVAQAYLAEHPEFIPHTPTDGDQRPIKGGS